MTRARILFVDDEPAILDALSDLLRKDRKRWDLAFAGGGPEALAELARAPYDIVVTDMRMPGMDGAELLARVKADYPSVTRLVLSGHADRGALMRAITVAHQFLSKPCGAALLRSTIERAQALRAQLESDAVRAVVGNITQLPVVPRTYLEVARVAADPTKGLPAIARVIESDSAMSAKVLQLVSSSYFGTRGARSIQQAIGVLGIDLLQGLTLTANAFSAAQQISIPGFSAERLQGSAMLCARIAKRLAPPELAEEAFTAALVHDLGKIVLALGMPQEVARVYAAVEARGEAVHVVERELVGTTHAEVGAYLLGMWGLPLSIVEAVAYHHAPERAGGEPRPLLALVHLADALVAGAQPDPALLERLGLAPDVARWHEVADECTREVMR